MKIITTLASILFLGAQAFGATPYAPSALVGTAKSASSINLTWLDHSSIETGFYIERSGSSSSGFVKVGSVGANVKTFTDSGLSSSAYYYRVRAFLKSSSGVYTYSSYSNVASAHTLSLYNWSVGAWSNCSVSACGQTGVQTRSVVCKRNDGTVVADSNCHESKPASSKACSTAACTSSGMPSGAINVRNYGAVPNDSVDDTVAIQKAIDATPSGGTVWLPAGKYLVNGVATSGTSGNFLKLTSNLHFMMDPAAVIQIKPNSSIRYYGLSTNGANNVEISGGAIVGERNQHSYVGTSTHEWGMCIGVTGSSGVHIHDILVKDCTGDGIVTGGQSHSIVIERVVSTNNRRQGLSLTNSYDVIVRNSEFSYTNGTAPEAGIDIEPDLPREARNIRIENNKLHHNAKVGIIPYIQSYEIKILNNEISYNNLGIYVRGSRGGEISGNLISHNKNLGLRFENPPSGQVATTDYGVSNNKFFNNSTNSVGVITSTPSYTAVTGVGSTSLSTWQVQVMSSCCDVKPSILTNYYAK